MKCRVFEGDECAAMNVEDSGLITLNDFVSQILSWTENVKKILENECNEARYVLRPWPIETMVLKKIDESCCTCGSKASIDNHVDEIVEGIGRALTQAQQLREKIAINVSKQKRKIREPDVQTIYMPTKSNSSTKRDPAASKTEKLLKKESKQGCKIVGGKKMECQTKSIEDRKLLRVSAGNVVVPRTKVTKNFVAANKSNIKNLKGSSKSTNELKSGLSGAHSGWSKDQRATSSSQTSSSCSASIAELNRLVDKVSIEEAKRSSGSSVQETKDDDCPCHGSKADNFVEQRVRTTVDTMEGLDRFGVPGDVVRILKMYHSYLSKELSSIETTASDKKAQSAANRFLDEFSVMTEERHEEEKKFGDPEITSLIVDFSRLFRDAHSQRIVDPVSNETTERYIKLDNRTKNCQLKKFNPSEFRKMQKLKKCQTNARGWSSNGVWNRLGADIFPDVTRTLGIRYTNRSQLSLFYDLNQRLQQLHYHHCLIKLLIEKVMPDVRHRFHHDTSEYSEAYKMFSAIAQLLNPTISVLVRTDI